MITWTTTFIYNIPIPYRIFINMIAIPSAQKALHNWKFGHIYVHTFVNKKILSRPMF